MKKLQLALIIFVVVVTLGYVLQYRVTTASPIPANQQSLPQPPQGLDYSKFLHNSRNHGRLPCLLCHRRESNSPRPQLPGRSDHAPCAGCDKQQYSNSGNPICTICRTGVKSSALKSFPPHKSFRMKFDHSLHQAVEGVSCPTYHRPSLAGSAL